MVERQGGRRDDRPRRPVPLVARVTSGVESVDAQEDITVDRTLSRSAVAPSLFSPNGDGRRETVSIGFTLSRQAQVARRHLRGLPAVATAFAGTVAAGRKTVTWNGGDVADGRLRVIVPATTSLGTRKQERPLVLDTTRPRVTVLVARRERRGTFVRLQVSERANLAVRLGHQLVRRSRVDPAWSSSGAGSELTRVTVYSTDLAGNSGRPATPASAIAGSAPRRSRRAAARRRRSPRAGRCGRSSPPAPPRRRPRHARLRRKSRGPSSS